MILIMYSGLQSLPKEPFEAIAIDGANRLQIFLYLTLPMLRPVILVALLFRTIDAYRAFDVIWIMTRGGPGRVTENLAVFTYKTGFREWNVGYSAASGVIMLIGALIISFALVRRVAKT
jgi:multiple sugar transport system permease protein